MLVFLSPSITLTMTDGPVNVKHIARLLWLVHEERVRVLACGWRASWNQGEKCVYVGCVRSAR